MNRFLAVSIISATAMIAGCASNSYEQITREEVGRVIDVHQVESKGSYGLGAVLGAAVGLASAQGHSKESKVIRGTLGAVAGGAISKGLTSGKLQTYVTVKTRSGLEFQVKRATADLMHGDCVIAEINGSYVRLKRAQESICRG